MSSEYLDRLKHLRDAKPPADMITAPNVQSNVSFRKAIDYIEKLENKNTIAENRIELIYKRVAELENQEVYLLTRLKEADKQRIPEELFDGYSVTVNIQAENKCKLKPLEVSDVLDAVVRMIKERLTK